MFELCRWYFRTEATSGFRINPLSGMVPFTNIRFFGNVVVAFTGFAAFFIHLKEFTGGGF
jgi:hypothetical protein